MKKLLSRVLAAALVFTMTAVPVKAAGTAQEVKEDGSTPAVETIEPKYVQTGEEYANAFTTYYDISVTNDADKSYTLPLTVQATGKLFYMIKTKEGAGTGNVSFILSSDAEGQTVIKKTDAALDSVDYVEEWADVKAGTYYLTVKVDGEITGESAGFLFTACNFRSGNQVLKNKKTAVSASDGEPVYFKVSVAKPSTLFLQFDGFDKLDGKVVLCDKNKKALSKSTNLDISNQWMEIYTVEKGTYYYKITTKNQAFAVNSTAESYKDPAGKSASKAKALKVNKETEGFVSINDKTGTTDYYKYTSTKAGQLKGLYVAFDGQGTIKVTVKIPGVKSKTVTVKGGQVYHIDSYYETMETGGQTYYRDKSFPKGTYTISIKKVSKATNGSVYVGTKLYKA